MVGTAAAASDLFFAFAGLQCRRGFLTEFGLGQNRCCLDSIHLVGCPSQGGDKDKQNPKQLFHDGSPLGQFSSIVYTKANTRQRHAPLERQFHICAHILKPQRCYSARSFLVFRLCFAPTTYPFIHPILCREYFFNELKMLGRMFFLGKSMLKWAAEAIYE